MTMNNEERLRGLTKKCTTILENEKIPVSGRIKISVNRRARSRFGKCTKEGAAYLIEISERMFESDNKAIETVLLHELLHTCPRCMNHGKTWKAYADRINKKYGYQITVRARYEDYGLSDPGSREPVKYMIVCSNCGTEYPRKRKCNLVENVDRYACGKCGGKLEIR